MTLSSLKPLAKFLPDGGLGLLLGYERVYALRLASQGMSQYLDNVLIIFKLRPQRVIEAGAPLRLPLLAISMNSRFRPHSISP
jgi:hypothetical protein